MPGEIFVSISWNDSARFQLLQALTEVTNSPAYFGRMVRDVCVQYFNLKVTEYAVKVVSFYHYQ